ncbi:MAG: alpha/beta hydrolase [Deltaproteobacteria bacterium]|nr:alpha/beta hydrolase [Deltaproteobacteria bacterium]
MIAPVQVRKRLVIYVQGYDPRGLAEYYRMFRREFRRTCELYGLTGNIGSAKDDPKRFMTTWDMTSNGDGWQVQTHYVFLRWEDIIRKDFARPPWWKIVHMYRTMGLVLLNGVVARIWKAHWRFCLFALYPVMLTTFWLLLGAFFGALCMKLVAGLGAPVLVANFVGIVSGLGAFASMLWLTEPQTYLLYLCDDEISTHQFAHGKRQDWEQRMKLFAGYVADAVHNSEADEAIIVGHSSGSFLAVDVLDRALTQDPQLGEHGPRVRLLTLGANLPIIGFNPEAKWFRDRLRRLAVASNIDWVDYQSRHDIMNFWPFDPVDGHGIVLADGERRNPTVVAISFRDLWKPGNFGRRRWRFFQAHFQFLLANERLGAAYDYYLICCGPLDLMTRATAPQEAIAAMAVKTRPGEEPAATR